MTEVVDRFDATKYLLSRLQNELVVTSLANPAFDLYLAGDRPENFYTWGGMGCAISIGCGLAMSAPHKKVIVLDGDGSLLMNLGALTTVGRYKPANLVEFVWDNETYDITGGQATASAHSTELADVARACGIENVLTITSMSDLERAADRFLTEPGPWVVIAKTGPTPTTRKTPIEALSKRFLLKEPFMQAVEAGDA